MPATCELQDGGVFVIRNYHRAKAFSNFLPGVAGLWRIPLWCYYVNRGQAVACFGAEGKDRAMVQFPSAYLHCQPDHLHGGVVSVRERFYHGGTERRQSLGASTVNTGPRWRRSRW